MKGLNIACFCAIMCGFVIHDLKGSAQSGKHLPEYLDTIDLPIISCKRRLSVFVFIRWMKNHC